MKKRTTSLFKESGPSRGSIGIRSRLFLLLIIVLVPVLLVEAVIYYQRVETRKKPAGSPS